MYELAELQEQYEKQKKQEEKQEKYINAIENIKEQHRSIDLFVTGKLEQINDTNDPKIKELVRSIKNKLNAISTAIDGNIVYNYIMVEDRVKHKAIFERLSNLQKNIDGLTENIFENINKLKEIIDSKKTANLNELEAKVKKELPEISTKIDESKAYLTLAQ